MLSEGINRYVRERESQRQERYLDLVCSGFSAGHMDKHYHSASLCVFVDPSFDASRVSFTPQTQI